MYVKTPYTDFRFLTVAKLREILADMPDDFNLETNYLGNLIVFSGQPVSSPTDTTFEGYIDFNAEEFVEA